MIKASVFLSKKNEIPRIKEKDMIIDCHGHYTTAPEPLQLFREAQVKAYKDGKVLPEVPHISDEQIQESIEKNQLKLLDERGLDMTIFSPRASAMAHHVGNEAVSKQWTSACNDLIARVVDLYPERFIGVCQLPQSPGVPIQNSPSGGHWTSPPLTDRSWYPMYEKMIELDVPAMIHVSGSCNSNFHATGAHYMNADTTAFMQFLEGDLFKDFPELRFVIPHGGGAVPYHWGRYRGLADMMKKPHLREHVMKNVYFDTCVYHQPGIDLLFKVIDIKNILFGSEMIGAVRGIDPETGHFFDDTKRYVDGLNLSDDDRTKVYSGNARRVYPGLDKKLTGRGI
jgi:4-oxalmesaconate hydratase